MINYRLGDALLYQFRKPCGNYKRGWNGTYKYSPNLEYDSPILSPWLKRNMNLPSDWYAKTDNVTIGCGYKTELKMAVYRGNFKKVSGTARFRHNFYF